MATRNNNGAGNGNKGPQKIKPSKADAEALKTAQQLQESLQDILSTFNQIADATATALKNTKDAAEEERKAAIAADNRSKALKKTREEQDRLVHLQKDYDESVTLLKESGGSTYKEYKLRQESLKKAEETIKKLEEYEKQFGLNESQKGRLETARARKESDEASIANLKAAMESPNGTLEQKISNKLFNLETSGASEGTMDFTSQLLQLSGNVFGDEFTNQLMAVIPGGEMLNALIEISDICNKLYSNLDQYVNQVMETYSSYMGSMDARLQGLGVDFNDMIDNFNGRLTGSPFFKATTYIEKLNELTEKGIGYNLEQRSLISTIGNKLVSTFEVTNDTLLRMIRLQQGDMTYSQLGAEALLTQFLNSNFQDSSYLSGEYDAVTTALTDAVSQMSKENATAFLSTVQTWLGSLYSVGFSGASTIAQGLNYLATGDVSGLNSNSSLQNLMALSASRAGLDLADILTEGLNASDANELLKSMVLYLQDIATNSDTQVEKAEYARIFNSSVSDFRAIQNLTDADIANIYSSSTVDYSTALSSYKTQLQQLSARTTLKEKIDNVVSNLQYSFGSSIADNQLQYLAWTSTGVMNKIAEWFGEQGVAGTIVSKALSIVSGLGAALPLLSGFLEMAGDLAFSGITNLGNYLFNEDYGFQWAEWTSRGNNFSGISGVTEAAMDSILTGISSSGSASSVGTSKYEQNLQTLAANANAVTLSGTTIVGADDVAAVRTVADIYAQLFDNQRSIRVSLASVEAVASETLTNVIMASGVNTEDENSIAANTKKTAEIIEKKLDKSTSEIASSITNKVYEVKMIN